MASVTNPRDQPCQQNFAAALADILVVQGEEAGRVRKIVEQGELLGSVFEYGPRPFLVSSQTGTDYSFFVEKKGDHCVLRLYARQKGFTRYTNNLTYIESRNLSGCQCHE